jgi:hypothetical protein
MTTSGKPKGKERCSSTRIGVLKFPLHLTESVSCRSSFSKEEEWNCRGWGFPFATASRPTLEPAEPPIQWVQRALSLRSVRGMWYTSTPHTSSCRGTSLSTGTISRFTFTLRSIYVIPSEFRHSSQNKWQFLTFGLISCHPKTIGMRLIS